MFLKNSCDGHSDTIDVKFTKACDNSCSFCIEKDGLDSFGKTDVNKIAESVLRIGIKDVLILGGEPFLQPTKLLELIKLIRKDIDKIFITTSLPKSVKVQDEIIIKILSLIDGLNVSIQSTNWKENNKILQAKYKHNRLEILKDLNKYFPQKIRTNINLVRGGIDSKEKLEHTLIDLNSIGCEHVKINELQHSKDLYVSYEEIMGIKLKSPYSTGCNTILENFLGMKIELKRSCFMVEESRTASLKDFWKVVYKKLFYKSKNKFRVIYENGEISNQWRKK